MSGEDWVPIVSILKIIKFMLSIIIIQFAVITAILGVKK